MTAGTADGHVEFGGRRHERAGPGRETAECVRRRDVQGVCPHELAPGAPEHPALEHDVGTAVALLAWLEHEEHLPGEVDPVGGKKMDRPDRDRRMQVVAARVHPAGHLGGEVESRVLLQREAVEVGAQEHGRAWPAPRDPHERRGHRTGGAGIRALDLDGQLGDRGHDPVESLRGLKAQLRVPVDVPADRLERLEVLGGLCGEILQVHDAATSEVSRSAVVSANASFGTKNSSTAATTAPPPQMAHTR